jgi:hypothetical protein
MKEKIRQFMIRRYGVDQLSNALNILFLILMLLGMFTKQSILLIIALIVEFYNYYRIFSKNFSKRYNENRIYTNFMSPVYNLIDKIKKEMIKNKKRDKKNYKYFHCKKCSRELRIPRGKGKVTITCPICKHSFDGRS